MHQPQIVLASSSPYRQQLLRQLGITFISAAPAVDESPKAGEEPAQLAARLSREKAAALRERFPDAVIIGSDQVADLNGQTMGKPHTPEVAFTQLSACSGRTVRFHTGVAVATGRALESGLITTQVHFRLLSASQIRAYIKKEAALDCAGSFKCEGLGISLFESIQSDDPTALIGLPLITLTTLLRRAGVDPLAD